MFTSIITTAGINAIASAQTGGYLIDLVRFKVSDTVITETDPNIIRAYTELPGTIQYDSGNLTSSSQLKYEVLNDANIVITVFLQSNVGTFDFGSIGLYLSDGSLFTILKLEQTYPKIANSGSIVGNNYTFPFVFTLTLQEVLNLSLLPENAASLPTVSTETGLPNYNVAPYSNYFIQNYAATGISAIACRTPNEWQFVLASHQEILNDWIHVDPSLFDSDVQEGEITRFNYDTNKWSLADGLDATIKLLGVREGDGVRTKGFYYKNNAYIANTNYFCDTHPTVGALTTISTRWYIGSSLSNSILYIDPQLLDTDLLIPVVNNLYQASIIAGNIIQLSLPDTGIYPAAYETGLEVQFICPATTGNNQVIQIEGLPAVPLTKMLVGQTSVANVQSNDVFAGTLVTAVFLPTDGINGGFRLLPSQVNDKVSRSGDIMSGNLTLPSATFTHSTDTNKDKRVFKYDDTGRNELREGLTGDLTKDFVKDFAPTVPKFYNASGKIDFNQNQLKNIADPSDAKDAVNKDYVDNSSTRTPLGYLYGLTLANNTAFPLTQLDVVSGITRDSSNSTDLTLSSTYTKDLSLSWVAGSNQGGRFAGVSLTNATWYSVFIIKNASGQVDIGFDNNINATNRPNGYTFYRRIGSIYYISAGGGIKGFIQLGNRFEFTTPIQDLTAATQSIAVETLRTLTLPTGLRSLAHLNLQVANGGASAAAYVKIYSASSIQSTIGTDATMFTSTNNAAAILGTGQVSVLTNLSAQVKTNASTIAGTPTVTLNLYTNGWTDLDLGVVNSTSAPAGSVTAGGQIANWALLTYDLPAGTNGGGNTVAGAWTPRTLNTEVYDTNNIVGLSGSQFVLQPGNYILEAWQAFSYGSGGTQAAFRGRLRDLTNNTTVATSIDNRGASPTGATDGVNITIPPTYVTITAATTYQLEYYAESIITNGLGLAFNTGENERYAAVSIRNADTTAAALPPGHLSGLALSNNVVTPLTKLDIAPGAASDSTGVKDLRLNATTSKLINAPFLTGNNQGGLASNLTLTNGTWYHVFIIANSTTVDIYFDSDINALNRPSNYNFYRYIGSIYYIDSISGIRGFTQKGSKFFWNTPGNLSIVAINNTTFTVDTPPIPTLVNFDYYWIGDNYYASIWSSSTSGNSNVLNLAYDTNGSTVEKKGKNLNMYSPNGSLFKFVQSASNAISENISTVWYDNLALGGSTSSNLNTNTPITFSANATSNQVASGSPTKITLANITANVGGYFNSTLSRFQPQVAGYYEFKFGAENLSTNSDAICFALLYLNGVEIARANERKVSGVPNLIASSSRIQYMNGSTDYVELYALMQSVETTIRGSANTFLQGFRLNDQIAPQTGLLPPNYLTGFTTSNSTVTPLTVIDIGGGAASDSTGSFDIKTNTNISKNIASTWVFGTGNGGLASSLTLTNDTWYHLYIISDGANIDAYFDTSLTAINKPAGYKYFRRIASVYYINAVSGIRKYFQIGDEFQWAVSVNDFAGTTNATPVNTTISTPLGLKTLARIKGRGYMATASGVYFLNIYSTFNTADIADFNNCVSACGNVSFATGAAYSTSVITDENSQVRRMANSTMDSTSITTVGWKDLALGSTSSSYNQDVTPTVPYAVNYATTDANGDANFINKVDNTTIGFTFTRPIRTTFPDGSKKSYSNSTQLPNITGINTDGTYFIVEEVGGVYVTTLKPVELKIAPIAPSLNQLWLDLSVRPYEPKKWNGSSWVVTQFNKWGEFIRTGGVIPTIITNYSLNRRYTSDIFTVTVSTNYNKPSNIGTENVRITLYFRENATYKWQELGGHMTHQQGLGIIAASRLILDRNTTRIRTGDQAVSGRNSNILGSASADYVASGQYYIEVTSNF